MNRYLAGRARGKYNYCATRCREDFVIVISTFFAAAFLTGRFDFREIRF